MVSADDCAAPPDVRPDDERMDWTSCGAEKLLKEALLSSQFTLWYQPKVDLRTGELSGVEALLRWRHPVFGNIPPSEFIPVAESCGMIVSIGEWALHCACRQAAAWRDEGRPEIAVSVNLSPYQLLHERFVETVRRSLAHSGLPPQLLELEITESRPAAGAAAGNALKELDRLGVRISIDDFGTGYSSLVYLKRFPVRSLKIDRTFISECTVNCIDARIVKSIIDMAHRLQLRVVAEGVETQEQLQFLRENDCDEAQGFLFMEPVPPEELADRTASLVCHGIT